MWGSDQWTRQTPIELHPFELRGELVINVALLGLVLLFWLPLLPSSTAAIPKAASILSANNVVPRYIGKEPTMVLDVKEPDNGFCVSLGILAASDNYQVMTPNSCTSPLYNNQGLVVIWSVPPNIG